MNVTLTWNPNTEPDLLEYKVYVGTYSGTYDFNSGIAGQNAPFMTITPPATTASLVNLSDRRLLYFVVAAVDNSTNISAFSNEVTKINKAVIVGRQLGY